MNWLTYFEKYGTFQLINTLDNLKSFKHEIKATYLNKQKKFQVPNKFLKVFYR